MHGRTRRICYATTIRELSYTCVLHFFVYLYGIVSSCAAIVVITGRYRSGKSFLMNQLVVSDGSEGFSVGHTVESHTKGIWLSTETIAATTAGGEAIDVVFMDSEGLGATDKVRSETAACATERDWGIFVCPSELTGSNASDHPWTKRR